MNILTSIQFHGGPRLGVHAEDLGLEGGALQHEALGRLAPLGDVPEGDQHAVDGVVRSALEQIQQKCPNRKCNKLQSF